MEGVSRVLNFEETVKKGLKEVSNEAYAKGFYRGAITIIDMLEDAMKISGSEVVYPKWLETARGELKKVKGVLIEPRK